MRFAGSGRVVGVSMVVATVVGAGTTACSWDRAACALSCSDVGAVVFVAQDDGPPGATFELCVNGICHDARPLPPDGIDPVAPPKVSIEWITNDDTAGTAVAWHGDWTGDDHQTVRLLVRHPDGSERTYEGAGTSNPGECTCGGVAYRIEGDALDPI